MTRSWNLSRGLVAATFLLRAAGADATPKSDTFPLGQSVKTGAVCEATRDYEDPAVQRRGAAAWAVRCRGWDGALGHLYAFRHSGVVAVANGGDWSKSLRARAVCPASKPLAVAGLPGTREAGCQAVKGQTPYLSYVTVRGGSAFVAEGLAPLADLLETGLRVVAGVSRPPTQATDVQTKAAAASGGATVSLSEAADAARASPELVRQRGYAQNQAWAFSNAGATFRPLAVDPDAAPRDRAEAFYNLALNVSNLSRYDEAVRLFGDGDKQASLARDPTLNGLALNYRALDARNQRHFAEAIKFAEAAIAARRRLSVTAGGGAVEVASGSANEITISGPLASRLNRRDTSRSFIGSRALSAEERLAIQDAQALYVIGSSQSALGDDVAGVESLNTANGLLANPSVLNSAAWLRARIDAELARIELRAGHVAEAKSRLVEALATLRRKTGLDSLQGSGAEAGLILEYARVEAVSGDIVPAIADFERGFALFREVRGSLGASADAAGVYLDLLIKQRAADLANAARYDDKFFIASQSVVSEATAETVAKLSARMAQGDSVSAGVARALEDTRRRVRIQESQIQQMQSAGAYVGAPKSAADAELKSLNEEAGKLEAQLLAANPRYGQLQITTVALSEMQSHLRPGEAYLKIVLLGERGYGILVTPTKVLPYVVPLTRAKAEEEVAQLRKPFDASGRIPRFDVAHAHAIFTTLLGPAADDVVGAKHLVFDPDGALISFPAAVMVTDQASVDLMANRLAALKKKGGGVLSYADVKWLGRSTDTSLVVSASSFLQARGFRASAAAKPFIGFGDAIIGSADDPRLFASVVGADAQAAGAGSEYCENQRREMGTMRRLTETASEVSTVGERLGAGPDDEVLGADFTDSAVQKRSDLNQYRVVYFATHGLLPQPGECLPQPALVTSLGVDQNSDALLDTVKILDLRMDADLVVLSACNTGGASQGGAATGLAGTGEALGGLTRAFIYAGSRGLIVSHWEVDSKATQALMTDLFTAPKADAAIGQSEALRQAELRMMDSEGFSHPYFWAAFTVVGDGARAMPTRQINRAAANGSPAVAASGF